MTRTRRVLTLLYLTAPVTVASTGLARVTVPVAMLANSAPDSATTGVRAC